MLEKSEVGQINSGDEIDEVQQNLEEASDSLVELRARVGWKSEREKSHSKSTTEVCLPTLEAVDFVSPDEEIVMEEYGGLKDSLRAGLFVTSPDGPNHLQSITIEGDSRLKKIHRKQSRSD